MNLFQYWDQCIAPPDVSQWMDSVCSANPSFTYRRFDRDAARTFVAKRFGARAADAFTACAVPAMQADILRLFLLAADGGLYVDADHIACAPLSSPMDATSHLLMTEWLGFAGTGIFLSRAPDDPFILACLELALNNIEARRFDSVLFATGPIVCNAVRYVADPQCRSALDFVNERAPWPKGYWARTLELAWEADLTIELIHKSLSQMTLLPVHEKVQWLTMPDCSYKLGPNHWENWTGSIYRD